MSEQACPQCKKPFAPVEAIAFDGICARCFAKERRKIIAAMGKPYRPRKAGGESPGPNKPLAEDLKAGAAAASREGYTAEERATR